MIKMDEIFVRNRITELRLAADISEHQLSLELGRSKSYIQSISSGRTSPSLSALFEICNYFNITPLEFFDNEIDNPELMHNIIANLKQLSNDDLEFFNLALEKYINKS